MHHIHPLVSLTSPPTPYFTIPTSCWKDVLSHSLILPFSTNKILAPHPPPTFP